MSKLKLLKDLKVKSFITSQQGLHIKGGSSQTVVGTTSMITLAEGNDEKEDPFSGLGEDGTFMEEFEDGIFGEEYQF